MGALYGFFCKEHDLPANTGKIMADACGYWGSDNSFSFSEPGLSMGYNHRFNTPEAVFESQPYKNAGGNVVFFNGRIDNRKYLIEDLNLTDSAKLTDGQIASAVYNKYGTNAAAMIEGDWVVAAWNSEKKELKILRDQHGYSALYYYRCDKFFAFGTCIKSLLALDAIPKKPNLKRVAQVLTSWQGNGTTSGYENIFRLPPAHFLEISKNLEVKKTRYWFPEETRPLILKDENEHYTRFFEEYSRAVEVRLRSYKPVGSQLSGGLDSGTVVALAAGLLKKENKKLDVFTSVPAFSVEGMTSARRFGDEGELARMTADFTGNAIWHPVDAADVDPFNAVRESLNVHDEPFHAGANAFWINEIKKQAHGLGLGTMLTGQGGNATVSWPTPGFLQIMSRKSDLIKMKHFFTWYGWRHVILPLYLPDSVKTKISGKHKGKMPFLEYSAIRKDWAISNRVYEQMVEEDHDPSFSKKGSPLKTRLKIIKPGSSIVGFLHSQSAAMNDLEMRDPTFDRKLMEYCLSVPDHIYVSGGKDRMLLRKSFEGLLPPQVLWNINRGRQAADIGNRVLKFRKSGETILDELSASALCREMLDLEKMKNILLSLDNSMNMKNNTDTGTILLRGITAGLFLCRFD